MSVLGLLSHMVACAVPSASDAGSLQNFHKKIHPPKLSLNVLGSENGEGGGGGNHLGK